MTTTLLLEMIASAAGDRAAVGPRPAATYDDLLAEAQVIGSGLRIRGVRTLGYLGLNGPHLPALLFGAAAAGAAFAPLNYRLTDEQLGDALLRLAPLSVVADPDMAHRITGLDGVEVLDAAELRTPGPAVDEPGFVDPDSIAVILLTSGTSGPPKAALLRHQHLMTYIVQTVELAGAGPEEAILVSVPPYHIAAISSVLSSVYAGRRMVNLPAFSPEGWIDAAAAEAVTHAMVVPTMLGRILDELERRAVDLPALRHLSYGGGRMPIATVERALRLLPRVDFVNAYGLTETSSTIALLGPEDHRAAFASDVPAERARLGSVGKPLPSIELEIRDADGGPVEAGVAGEIWVRGEQVSGEYLTHRATDAEGWYPTRDRGRLDAGGYLFLDGRADDVIVRGGENIAPGEIEDVLVEHPAVAEAAVVGLPDVEWGERIEAFVVPVAGHHPSGDDLRAWVRARLRSTRTPERVHFRTELPSTDTGKLLRRQLRADVLENGVGG
jgi:acyl-CoA synthetase (AMP-forming)/AMP-acid ligase II